MDHQRDISFLPDFVALSVVQAHAGVDAAGEDDLAAGVDHLAVVVGGDVRPHLCDLAVLDEDVCALEGLIMVDNLIDGMNVEEILEQCPRNKSLMDMRL